MLRLKHSDQKRNLRSDPLHLGLLIALYITISLSLSACANTELNVDQGSEVSKNDLSEQGEDGSSWADRQADSSEMAFTPGNGARGGYDLISALIPPGCVAYPISEQVLITTSQCLAECIYDSCDIAVMTTGTDPIYIGLAKDYVVSPIFDQGEVEELSFEGGLGLIYLDRISEELSNWTLSFEGSQTVTVFGESREVIEQGLNYGKLASTTSNCPASSTAVFNEFSEIIGLSLARRGQCDDFISLKGAQSFLGVADNLNYTQGIPLTRAPKPEMVDTEALERAEAERRWSEEEAEALNRAPACDEQTEAYCDGDVELSCSGGNYRALHCGRVGWSCRVSETWGASCEP